MEEFLRYFKFRETGKNPKEKVLLNAKSAKFAKQLELNLANSTSLAYLASLASLAKKEKILLYLLQPHTISEIRKEFEMSASLTTQKLRYPQRNDGLFDEGYVDIVATSPNKYQTTEKGKQLLLTYIKQRNLEIDKENAERQKQHIYTEWKTYLPKLIQQVSKGKFSLTIDFQHILKFDPELADMVLDNPSELIKIFEIALEHMDLLNKPKHFKPRFINLPKTERLWIREIRNVHVGKLKTYEGVVRQRSLVRPQVTSCRFECPSCGEIIPLLQTDAVYREPTKCGCGKKGKFNLLSKELIDVQHLKLEEMSEDLDGTDEPQRINVFLEDDLTSIEMEKITTPGSNIRVVGFVKEIPIIKKGGRSTVLDYLLEANSIESLDDNLNDIELSPQDIDDIKKLSKEKKLLDKLKASVCPAIQGHDKIKEALLVQLFGGEQKVKIDGTKIRGDIHILLIGDPGTAKSQMVKRVGKVTPKGKYATGHSSSGVGLTAAVVKDEFLGGYTLEAGALVLANKGLCCIDELDKMNPDDRNTMHEALEQQTVTINKAIKATLPSQTSVLAAANPKLSRFDPYNPVSDQIDLPSTLISRFDLIFPIKDVPDQDKDSKLAEFILGMKGKGQGDSPIETVTLRKYIAYARKNIKPDLNVKAQEVLKNYFLSLRNSCNNKNIAITARQLEGLQRLSEGYARMRLSNEVESSDAEKAVEMMKYSLKQVAYDQETGQLDIDRIATDTPSSKRNKIHVVKGTIKELMTKIGKQIPMEDIEDYVRNNKITETELDEIIKKLKESGDIFEPKRGFIQLI